MFLGSNQELSDADELLHRISQKQYSSLTRVDGFSYAMSTHYECDRADAPLTHFGGQWSAHTFDFTIYDGLIVMGCVGLRFNPDVVQITPSTPFETVVWFRAEPSKTLSNRRQIPFPHLRLLPPTPISQRRPPGAHSLRRYRRVAHTQTWVPHS